MFTVRIQRAEAESGPAISRAFPRAPSQEITTKAQQNADIEIRALAPTSTESPEQNKKDAAMASQRLFQRNSGLRHQAAKKHSPSAISEIRSSAGETRAGSCERLQLSRNSVKDDILQAQTHARR